MHIANEPRHMHHIRQERFLDLPFVYSCLLFSTRLTNVKKENESNPRISGLEWQVVILGFINTIWGGFRLFVGIPPVLTSIDLRAVQQQDVVGEGLHELTLLTTGR